MPTPIPEPEPEEEPEPEPEPKPGPKDEAVAARLRVAGQLPPEVWNRFGTKVLPKLRSGKAFSANVDLFAEFEARIAQSTQAEIQQLLDDLGLSESFGVERE